ncbi:ubiquitin carboxyl-terminal hydrolase 16 isoform 1-T1 [Synchiropus picturatus]
MLVDMGKKRGKSSREEDEFLDLTVPSCRHIRKGTDQTIIKKVPASCKWTTCQDCNEQDEGENADAELMQELEDEADAVAVWMCLKCGHRGCGRHSENKHAIKHYETPRSDPHCLVISLDQWSVWCYICDEEVQYSRTSHLAQLVANLKKKVLASDPENQPQKKVKDEDVILEVEPVKAEDGEEQDDKENRGSLKKNSKKEKVGKQKNIPGEDCGSVPVKGLSNLGNTCFFNAVIQNLSQTQQLRETLSKVKDEKMSVTFKPPASSNLESIVALLDDPGPLTMAMCKLLNEIQESSRSTVLPQELFSQVCKKAARFKGFQQQDSQELLRYLLDGMRAEEIKRATASVMEKLKEMNKNDEELKDLVKEYEKIGFRENFVDQVFGGETTSTIMCQQCKTVSVVNEMFLDLSLPVSEEAYRKFSLIKGGQKMSESHRHHSGDSLMNGTDDSPSSSGSKYQQKKAKKQAKKQAKSQKRQQKMEGRMILNTKLDTEGSALDEPEEDSVETSEENQKNLDSVKTEEEKEEQEDSTVDCESPVNNRFTVLSEDGVISSPNPDPDSDLVNEMEELNLDDAFLEPSSDRPEESSLETSEYTVVNQDPELAFQTLAPRPPPEKQECSVYSCLFQFTDVETLSHSNSLLCVTCTKQKGSRNKTEAPKKNVYTDALKQMLISSPPPVLTLHLKRFQQIHYMISKVNRHVNFPLVLDLAPFCAVNCKNLSEGDTRVMYSLYGIVQHSGTMKRGHYTAYVKVRPQSPKPPSAAGDAETPKGSWYHISDTSVQPVSESTVLGCQAYLLFYERIF